MNASELISALDAGTFDGRLVALYGVDALAAQRERYGQALVKFRALYGERENVRLLSVSGRSELSGNHTDHNLGCVIAASVDLDILAVVAPTADTLVRINSEGYPEDVVDISEFTAPHEACYATSAALIAGVCTGLRQNGYRAGGCVAYTTSSVLKGSGLSSSAAFEVTVGNIQNHLYNSGEIDNVEIAGIAQYAENEFFGKPCGRMDQLACAVGGIITVDFEDPQNPQIERLGFDLTAAGYQLCIINTGGNHANLTLDYTAIPAEMRAVARALGKAVLREVDERAVIEAIPSLRESVGDRAILRALHFFAENRRVQIQAKALKEGDLDLFFENVRASGRSSFCYLQNVYTTQSVAEQGLSLALCLSQRYLEKKSAAWRVHGGGFAGTVQAFVRTEETAHFKRFMDGIFGKGACMVLRIRPEGATVIY